MARKEQRLGEDTPENPEDLLPEGSILSLDEYLAMQQSIGNRTRFEIVYRLVHSGNMSPAELNEVIPIDDSILHYHLNKLVDVGVVELRKRALENDPSPVVRIAADRNTMGSASVL